MLDWEGEVDVEFKVVDMKVVGEAKDIWIGIVVEDAEKL